MGALESHPVGVVRVPEDGGVGPGVHDLLGLDAGDVGDDEVRSVLALARHEPMARKQALELSAEEEIDPNEQDRRHGPTLAVSMPPIIGVMGLEDGLALIRSGAYFEAHEELEDEWREAPEPERDFLQGLVHVAVAWYHAGRGNRPGCARQLEKAERRLARYRPSHRGVDIATLLEDVSLARERAVAGTLDLPAPRC